MQLVNADSLFLQLQSAVLVFLRRSLLGAALMLSGALFLITVQVLPWVSDFKVFSEG